MKNKQAFIKGFTKGYSNKYLSFDDYYNNEIKEDIEKLSRVFPASELNDIIESKKEGFKIGQESDDTCKDPIKHFECWENWIDYELPKETELLRSDRGNVLVDQTPKCDKDNANPKYI